MNDIRWATRAGIFRSWTLLASAAGVAWLFRTNAASAHWTLLVGLTVMALGLALNLVVMCANRGRMPVRTPHGDLGYAHIPMDRHTRLRFLGDWIDIRGWLISPGDICLFAGMIIALIAKLSGLLLESPGRTL